MGISEKEIIKIAIKSLGLDELAPFVPEDRIIEYLIKKENKPLLNMNLSEFAYETYRKVKLLEVDQYLHTVVLWVLHLALWLLIYQLIKEDGMINGKSILNGLKRYKLPKSTS